MAEEVNIYTTRQPELIQPVMDAFTDETGIAVNLGFVEEGIIERLVAEGKPLARRSGDDRRYRQPARRSSTPA